MSNAESINDLVQKAIAASKQNEFILALDLLFRAEIQADSSDARKLIRATREDIHHSQKVRAQSIVNQLEELQHQVSPDCDKATALVKELYNALGSEEQWLNQWQAWKRWRVWVEQLQAARQAEVEIKELESQLADKWYSDLVVDADEALEIINSKASAYSAYEAWKKLLERAQEYRKRAREREQLWLTLVTTSRYKKVLDEFRQRKQHGVMRLPAYVVEQGNLIQHGYIPSDEAITHLSELASKYEDSQAEELLAKARQAMLASPYDSKRFLEEALELEFITNDCRTKIKNELEKVVVPACQKRDSVETCLQEIIAQETDAWQAWMKIETLVNQDPHAPGIENARRAFRLRFRKVIANELDKAEINRRVGKWNAARDIASSIRNLISDDSLMADLAERTRTLCAQIEQDEILHTQITEQVTRIGKLAEQNLSQASQDLQVIEEQLRLMRRLSEFTQVTQLRRKIDARLDLQSFLQSASESLKSAQEPADLEPLERQCRDKLKKLGKLDTLIDLDRRLKARRAFLNAESAFHNGDMEQAAIQYDIVLAYNGDDQIIAGERMREIIEQEMRNKQSEVVKNHAQCFYQDGNLYLALRRIKNQNEDWTQTPSACQDEIAALYSAWLDEWKKQVVAGLKLLEKKSPLPYEAIERLLTHLREEAYDPVLSAYWDGRLAQSCKRAREQAVQGTTKRRKK